MELIAQKWTFERKSPGRPPVSQEVAELTVKLAKENPGVGFDKIQGMLANLGHEISDTTVKNILKQHGIASAPVRTKQTTWAEFLRSHTETVAACDFFTTEVWTLGGLTKFVEHFHAERNHRGLENKIIQPEDLVGKATGEIVCGERPGGLLKYSYRRAA